MELGPVEVGPASPELSGTPVEVGGRTDESSQGESRPPFLLERGIRRREALRFLGLGAAIGVPALASRQRLKRFLSALVSQTGPFAPAGATGVDLAGEAVSPHGRIRQWTMIIDLRYCDGCQSQGTPPQCTKACIAGHFAPEPMEWIEVFEDDLIGGGTQFVPTPCQQCQNPPCVNVCPVGATFSAPEGTVLIDPGRCIGCRICMAACPYDRRFFNWGDPPIPPEAELGSGSPETQVPAQRGTVMKCDFCPEIVRAGSLPFCIQACPNDAIYYGDLEEDVATNGEAVVVASRFLSEHVAYRLKEDLGTEPRVFYLPGSGELVGRDANVPGRMDTEWPWDEVMEGSVTWRR